MYVQIEIVWSMIQDDPTTTNERTNAVGRTVMRHKVIPCKAHGLYLPQAAGGGGPRPTPADATGCPAGARPGVSPRKCRPGPRRKLAADETAFLEMGKTRIVVVGETLATEHGVTTTVTNCIQTTTDTSESEGSVSGES